MQPEEFKKAMHGVTAIAITPMTSEGTIDEQGLREHLRFFVKNGVRAGEAVVVVTGSTGECGALDPEERYRAWDIALEELGDELPVVTGCNHSDVSKVRQMAERSSKIGAAGVMAVSPYYYTPTAEVVKDFYRSVADATDLGIMIYNNLEVTHFDIPVTVLEEICDLVPTVVGIKECTPNFVKMERVARTLGERLAVINGHGEFLEPYASLLGTCGFISSTANFAPSLAMDMWHARSTGDVDGAVKIRRRLSPYLDLAADLGAAGGEPKVLSLLKYLADEVGSKGGPGKLPLRPLNGPEQKRAQAVLKSIDLSAQNV